MTSGNRRVKILALLLTLALSITSSSCFLIPSDGDSIDLGDFLPGLIPVEEDQSPKHTINLGIEVELASDTIEPAGGTISVDKPGDLLDGFQIDVPEGAYNEDRDFDISSTPITGHDFGDNFNPATPLISVDNGGGYSAEPMLVDIPLSIPEGKFAMGFFYDKEAGTLEGIPIVEEDANHITIATCHFSDFLISLIDATVLKADIDSGFRPGVDDWQFENLGSYIAPKGHCYGQSVSAMWYYCEKAQRGAPHLYGLYDNNGGSKTPSFWIDDSRGYRLASVVQTDQNYTMILEKVGEYISESHELAYRAFAYAILLTGEPQYVRIATQDGSSVHAMIVYRVAANTLYVADPNYPGGTDRKIELVDGKFKPYNSGDNKTAIQQGQGKSYPLIWYLAKTTFVDWGQISNHWAELEDGTIGDDSFPYYIIRTVDGEGDVVELEDGYHTKNKTMQLDAVDADSHGLPRGVFRDGNQVPRDDSGQYGLNAGNNQLGIAVFGLVDGEQKYIDFTYINVVSEAEEGGPPKTGNHPVVDSITGPSGPIVGPGPFDYAINISGGTPPYSVEWRGNKVIYSGTGNETVSILRDQLRDNGEGYWVFITVKDSAGKDALWLNDDGIAKNDFTYGALNNGIVVTEPETFPYDMPGD